MFCGTYRKVCGKNGLRSGTMEIGFSTTMFPLTLLCLCSNFQEFITKNVMNVVPHLSYFPDLVLLFQNSNFH
jgi:hypothetical protein